MQIWKSSTVLTFALEPSTTSLSKKSPPRRELFSFFSPSARSNCSNQWMIFNSQTSNIFSKQINATARQNRHHQWTRWQLSFYLDSSPTSIAKSLVQILDRSAARRRCIASRVRQLSRDHFTFQSISTYKTEKRKSTCVFIISSKLRQRFACSNPGMLLESRVWRCRRRSEWFQI